MKRVTERLWLSEGLPGGLNGKESTCNAGDPSSIPGSGWSVGKGNGSPLSILAWKFHGQSLVGYSPWGRTESEMA